MWAQVSAQPLWAPPLPLGALPHSSLACGQMAWQACALRASLGIPGLEHLWRHPFLPSSTPEAVLSSAVGLSLGRPAAKAS